jgi:hypothetical protein
MDDAGEAGMKVMPLARYLAELPHAGTEGMIDVGNRASAAVDYKRDVEQAFLRGQEEGRAAARIESEATLKRERDGLEERLAVERRNWTAQQSEQLAASIARGLDQIETSVTNIVARLLEPILLVNMRNTVLDALKNELEALWTHDGTVPMRICRPADLLEGLRERIGTRSHAEYVESDRCEVRIEVGPTIIETRLAAWAATLGETLR